MKPALRGALPLSGGLTWDAAEPLWKVVPKRDEFGHPCTDFMMLAPGLNKRGAGEIEAVMVVVKSVLSQFEQQVVFANFNLKLNLLWVSLRHKPGTMSQIASLLHARVPMLKLVGHHTELGN